MTKEQKGATIKFLLWFITLSIICFIGMNDIFALSNYNQIQFFDNNGSSVSWKTTSWTQSTQESTATFGLTANSTGGLLVYMMSSPVVNNHIYSMFVNVGARNYGGATQLSSKNCIGLGNSEWSAANDYIACTLTPRFSASSGSTSEYRRGLFFTFIANKNAGYIAIPFTSTETVYDVPIYSYGLEMEDNGDSTNMTQQEVSNIVDTQTDTLEETIANIESNVSSNILNSQQAIISNQNANNQALIQNDNTNTQNIISNNNTNTDKIIADNKKNFQSCRDSVNLFSGFVKGIGLYSNNGSQKQDNNAATSDYIKVDFNTNSNYYLSGLTNSLTSYVAAYNSSKEFLGRTPATHSTYWSLNTTKFTNGTPQGTGDIAYLRVTIYVGSNDTVSIDTIDNLKVQLEVGSTDTSYEKFGEEICENKLDEQTKTSKGILGKLGDLFTSFGNFVTNLFDTSGPDTDSISGMAGWLPPGPVDSVINLPLTFFNTLNNSLGGSCQTFSVNLPFVNFTLNLPCFSSYMSQYVSNFSTLWTFIGTIASVVILYRYLLALYVWVDNVLMLRYQMHEDFGGNSANFGGV